MIISRYVLIISLITAMLGGCATAPVVVTPPIDPTATIDTMTSAVALSVKAGEKGLSGRGYLILRYPDQFRLVIVSPFGATMAEMFLAGDELLYLDSSRKLAYHGLLSDLPDAPVLQGWRLLRWTTERVSPETAGQERLSRMRLNGERETIEFDRQGLVLKKSMDGDEVRYEGYQSVTGVAVPTIIEIMDRIGITVRITLDEPEVNAPLDENAFLPALEGITILPLSQLPTS